MHLEDSVVKRVPLKYIFITTYNYVLPFNLSVPETPKLLYVNLGGLGRSPMVFRWYHSSK